jgi:hypothetical protein
VGFLVTTGINRCRRPWVLWSLGKGMATGLADFCNRLGDQPGSLVARELMGHPESQLSPLPVAGSPAPIIAWSRRRRRISQPVTMMEGTMPALPTPVRCAAALLGVRRHSSQRRRRNWFVMNPWLPVTAQTLITDRALRGDDARPRWPLVHALTQVQYEHFCCGHRSLGSPASVLAPPVRDDRQRLPSQPSSPRPFIRLTY